MGALWVLLLVAVVAGGLAWALRREGKRLDARRRTRELPEFQRLALAWTEFERDIGERLLPAMQQAARELNRVFADMRPALERAARAAADASKEARP